MRLEHLPMPLWVQITQEGPCTRQTPTYESENRQREANNRIRDLEDRLLLEQRRKEREIEDARFQERRKYEMQIARLRDEYEGRSISQHSIRSHRDPNNTVPHQVVSTPRGIRPLPDPNAAPTAPRVQSHNSLAPVVTDTVPVVSTTTPPAAGPIGATTAPVTPSVSSAPVVTAASSATTAPLAALTVTQTVSLIDIQTQAHAYNMLKQKRPRNKYTGENKKIDFEMVMNQFEVGTSVTGATDEMRRSELNYWFEGQAGLIVDRFMSDPDPSSGLKEAIRALKKEFGRKKLTAKKMLTELLAGDKIPEKEFNQVKTFVLHLERAYQVAKETKRHLTFDLPETIGDIIRMKLPHLAEDWAEKMAEAEDKLNETNGVPELTFTQFIAFVKKQNSIKQTSHGILKISETQKRTPPQRTTQNQNYQKPAYRNAAQTGQKTGTSTGQPTSTGQTTTQPNTAPKPQTQNPAQGQPRPSNCAVCPKAGHHTGECRKFAGLPPEERATIVRDKGLCNRCLCSGHIMRACTSPDGCGECAGNHHTNMHGVRLLSKATTGPPQSKTA